MGLHDGLEPKSQALFNTNNSVAPLITILSATDVIQMM